MKPKSIPLALVLSIVTCGIYAIFWFVSLTNDTNALAVTKTAGGWKAILFSILTLGIYTYYWAYKLGVKDGEISGRASRGVLYLVLSFIGVGFIVAAILTQMTVNEALARKQV
ncbi:MAG: DUF4234 domain-containing protein [Ruminococcaceae bacterium]|nr:DUF4234 domain-containing protein [Oscillospiraceae bacterium]